MKYVINICFVILFINIGNIAVAFAEDSRIPIYFELKNAGYVSLVIEDEQGIRVRNLIAQTWFKSGKNVVYWDGQDDLGRDVDAANHGLYHVPGKFVKPGKYLVRGIVRDEIKPKYEFSTYTSGNPPWPTADHKGGWLANHTPPMAALFLDSKRSLTKAPMVMLGSYVTEGPDGLAWVDLDGNKIGGRTVIGFKWTSAPYLAADRGMNADLETVAYVASVWETDKLSGTAELRVTGLTKGKDKKILTYNIGKMALLDSTYAENFQIRIKEIGGIAVNNQLAVISLTQKNELILADCRTGKIVGRKSIENPKGLYFDKKGRLLVISKNTLIRFELADGGNSLISEKLLISSKLDEPSGLTLDTTDRIFISDRGASHQIKVFNPEGKFISAIGTPGSPSAGTYDPNHMNNPAGIAVDSKNQIWVTEQDFLPKRVSVWSIDGKLIKAFYGPGKYGGGGTLDPKDKNRFYYADEDYGAMEFKLDWKSGTSQLSQVYYRKNSDALELAKGSAGPETPLYYRNQRYFTNCYNSNPTSGASVAFLFLEKNGLVKPIAAMGKASTWTELKKEGFKTNWPEGVNLNAPTRNRDAFFIWSDQNGDGKVQPNEVAFQKIQANGITITNDLSFNIARLGNQAVRYKPITVNADGIPSYSLNAKEVLAENVLPPLSSGGDQILIGSDGLNVITLGVSPYEGHSIVGLKNGVPSWSYPNMWPGLHASHSSPVPERKDIIIGPMRMLGEGIKLVGVGQVEFWAISGNDGNIYLLSTDGIFISSLFESKRTGKPWKMPNSSRNMSLDSISLGGENFWPTITQTADGNVYLTDGARSALIRLDGINSIKRLPDAYITLSEADLKKSATYQTSIEAKRQKIDRKKILQIPMLSREINVDGKLNDWDTKNFCKIDDRGVKAYFNEKTIPYNISAAIAVSNTTLYASWSTADRNLLLNSGELPNAPFKTGGALDLFIGVDANADTARKKPVEGDLRLLITLVKGKPLALVYQSTVPGADPAKRIPFSSPWRTVSFDKVIDVSDQIKFAGADGNYEIAIPLSAINLKPKKGLTLKGDVGILRGDGSQTTARVYWNNKATGITADVPSEAELTPDLWGTFLFE